MAPPLSRNLNRSYLTTWCFSIIHSFRIPKTSTSVPEPIKSDIPNVSKRSTDSYTFMIRIGLRSNRVKS